MNPESAPNQQPFSPEEHKREIEQLQDELQSMQQNDPSRTEKLNRLIDLLKTQEEHEGGEIIVPEHASITSPAPTAITNTVVGELADMAPPEQPFAQIKKKTE